MFDQIHGAVDVQVDGAPPQLGVDLGDGPDGLRPARAVHDTVQPAMPGGGCVDRPADLVLLGDVRRFVPHRTRPLGVDLIRGGAELVRIAADEHGVAAGGDDRGGGTLPIPLPPPVTRYVRSAKESCTAVTPYQNWNMFLLRQGVSRRAGFGAPDVRQSGTSGGIPTGNRCSSATAQRLALKVDRITGQQRLFHLSRTEFRSMRIGFDPR